MAHKQYQRERDTLIQVSAAVAVALFALAGPVASNVLYDRGASSSVSRRAAHSIGGAAYLLAVLWLNVWTAMALAGVLALSVLVLILGSPRSLRGVSRSPSTRDWAVVAYPTAATVSLAVGWGMLGNMWLAFGPIAFMAWGDSVAGLVRSWIRSGRIAWLVGGGAARDSIVVLAPSMVMLGVCLIVAALVQPYWIGVVGAIAATVAERFRLIGHSIWEGNWVPDDPVIVAASLAVMGALIGAGV